MYSQWILSTLGGTSETAAAGFLEYIFAIRKSAENVFASCGLVL